MRKVRALETTREPGRGEGRFHDLGHLGGQGAEDQVASGERAGSRPAATVSARRRAGGDGGLAQRRGPQRLGLAAARRAAPSRQRAHLKPRMIDQQDTIALADRAARAQYAHFYRVP